MLGQLLQGPLADPVTAIAVQSGALLLDGCAPGRPVAAMEIHGTADQTVPIDGGQGRRLWPFLAARSAPDGSQVRHRFPQ